jgi:hypothetical protein
VEWVKLAHDMPNDGICEHYYKLSMENFLNSTPTASFSKKTLILRISIHSDRGITRYTAFISLQRTSCFCHPHSVMNFTSSPTTHSQKASHEAWSLRVQGSTTLWKQIHGLMVEACIFPLTRTPYLIEPSSWYCEVSTRRKTKIYSTTVTMDLTFITE